ncbi:MAG: carbohydrate-binding protein [Eubacterium sp.]|nr:carbohydrate-binding protein [Eubacterium sp.]
MKRVKLWGKRMIAFLLLLVLMGSVEPVDAAPEKQTSVYETTPIPAALEEDNLVEVFSPNGSMKHVEVDPEEFKQFDARGKEVEPGQVQQIAETYNFRTKDLINNGSDSQNYCILICGDGYTAGEQDKFLNIAQQIADYFMTRSPFNESNIKNKINIRAVCTVSNASGTSLDPNAPYDTFFKATFNNWNIERLVCIHDETRLRNVINQYMPECAVPIVVCNSEKYGGSGGSLCCISAHSEARDIAFHEFGHTGGGLADEYWETTTDNRSEAPNRTHESDPSKCKWSDLIGVNGVGLYSHEEQPDWYRPHQRCEMRYLNQEFCEVCKREIRRRINLNVDSKIAENTTIYNGDQLKNYLQKVANGASTKNKAVTLANDITVSGTITSRGTFQGTFNGNGHKISGLNINVSDGYVGMFREVAEGAVVKNLKLENATIKGSSYYVGGIAGCCKGTIEQCSFSGTVTSSNAVGGIAGLMEGSGMIRDCYNIGTINATSQVAGGIVGWLTSGTVKNCYNTGSTSSGDGYWNGGVVGYKPGGTVTNCFYKSGTGNRENDAKSKSASDFTNGNVTNLLNSVNNVWKQGSERPELNIASQNVEPTTQPQNNNPEEVFGQVVSSDANNTITVVWGRNESMESKGQLYNIYVDNQKKLSNVACAVQTITGVTEGNHTVKITSVYNGKESSGVTATVSVRGAVTTTQAPTEAPTTIPSGFTAAGTEWTDMNFWSVYFANGWGNNPTGGYRNGNAYNNFSIYINNGPKNSAWAVQMKTKELSVVSGKKYQCKLTVNSSAAANDIRFKDDKSQTEKLVSLSSGTNNITLDFTTTTTAQIFIDLGNAPDNYRLDVTSFALVDTEPETTTKEVTTAEPTTQEPTTQEPTTEEPTTVTYNAYQKIEAEAFDEHQGGIIDNNSNASGGHNIGGISNGVTMQYDRVQFTESAGAFQLRYSSPKGTANGTVEIYVDSLNHKVGTIPLKNNGSNWQTYSDYTGLLDSTISAGVHKIYMKYVTKNGAYYVANVDYFQFVKASDTRKISGGIEINGYQISNTVDGMRTIFSVDNHINGQEVVSAGLIYGLAPYAADSDLYVGSSNERVISYECNASGLCKKVYAQSDFATSHSMTMKFGPKTVKEFSANWKIRAYAKLESGAYVYSDVANYTIYGVADRLYQSCQMLTEVRHNFLYNDILKKVQPNYSKKSYK